MVLCYGDHKGLPKLRELIAKEAGNYQIFLIINTIPIIINSNNSFEDISGGSLTFNDVLATTGAAGALFIIATSILRKGYAKDRIYNRI